MEFDFLPNLPKSDLDDRSFPDLVEECLLRIPRYCPEWSNHNPSDPGITLVELFAWLTDQMLLRFNQVPRRNYVAFLELLGLRLQPPAPAHTELTFYLSRPQTATNPLPPIPAGTEVATERTETEDAIVFSSDRPFPLGIPRLRYLLTGNQSPEQREPTQLSDRFALNWTETDDRWAGPQTPIFEPLPRSGDCLYFVFAANEPLDGHVVRLELTGEPAGSTGIDPDQPPRRWEAWDGQKWRSVLLSERDDHTQGFSFANQTQGIQQADVTLHLPLTWPSTTFANYQGRWLRCRYYAGNQPPFSRSPRLSSIVASTIGGTVPASQCALVRDERLGESNGNPGQFFTLQFQSILPRLEGEHLVVELPSLGRREDWVEVTDFADSGPNDRHYTLDSVTGRIQFGPLVREPGRLREEVHLRSRVQRDGSILTTTEIERVDHQERQSGAVPPRGAVIYFTRYRTGGGLSGNVPKRSLTTLKSAVPYISTVTNHIDAKDGADAEPLDEAVLRVPRLLRTRDRAVTPEDFEALTLQASRSVARAHCPRDRKSDESVGTVPVLVIPRVDLRILDQVQGIHPDRFTLSASLVNDLTTYLEERQLLGTHAKFLQPDYVGVSVQATVALDAKYSTSRAMMQRQMLHRLYEFLNPLTGGWEGTGWSLGLPLYQSDIMALFQQMSGVSYLEAVQLFELRRASQGWERRPVPTGVVVPGARGVIVSWADEAVRSGHTIHVLGAGGQG